jgi:predicted negative regulator of RcsB-dependent stress response
MSYAGSAQRIFRLRRRAHSGGANVAVTVLAIVLVLLAWVIVTAWYLLWGIWLIPYRILRRGARKRKAEALRHRELMGTIQGSAAASAAAIVMASTTGTISATIAPIEQPHVRVDAEEREQAATALHAHYVAGRLTHDELDDRVAQAYAARTRGDLASLLGDLPALPAGGVGTGA